MEMIDVVLSDRKLINLLDFFQTPNQTLRASYIKKRLMMRGYRVTERIVVDAINEGILIVRSLFPLKVSLSSEGRQIWRDLYR